MTQKKSTGSGSSGLILDRRELLAGASALGLAFGAMNGPAFAADTPKKGGTLRLGMEGGSASDSIDPRTYADSVPISYGYQIFNGMVEIDQPAMRPANCSSRGKPSPARPNGCSMSARA